MLKAFAMIRLRPDVAILDAQGIAHPRGIGLVSHIGLLLDKPSIGCAKTRWIGEIIRRWVKKLVVIHILPNRTRLSFSLDNM